MTANASKYWGARQWQGAGYTFFGGMVVWALMLLMML